MIRIMPVVHRTPRLLALSLATVVGVASGVREAKACSAPPCSINGFVAPRDGTTVPANAPALVYVPTVANANVAVPVELSTDTGPVAFAVDKPDTSLLRLLAPLEPGKTYQVRQFQSCSSGAPQETDYRTQSFVAGPAAPLPTTPGGLTLAQTTVEDSLEVDTSSGSCTTTIRAAVLQFAFTPSADLEPFLPVTSFTLTIAGQTVRVAQAGTDPNATVPGFFFSRPLLQLHAACDLAKEKDKWADWGIKLGTYDLVWQANVAGASVQPAPITGKVTFACDGSAAFVAAPAEENSAGGGGGAGAGGAGAGGGGDVAGAGGAGVAAGGSGGAAVGGGPVAGGGASGDPSSTDGVSAADAEGCSLGVGRAASTRSGVLSALAVVAAALRARRSRRQT